MAVPRQPPTLLLRILIVFASGGGMGRQSETPLICPNTEFWMCLVVMFNDVPQISLVMAKTVEIAGLIHPVEESRPSSRNPSKSYYPNHSHFRRCPNETLWHGTLTNFEDVSPIVLDVEGNMLFLMILEYAEKSPVLQDKEKIYCLLHSDICSEKKLLVVATQQSSPNMFCWRYPVSTCCLISTHMLVKISPNTIIT
jgi:hypothetical protein